MRSRSRSAISRNGPYHYRLMDGLLMPPLFGRTIACASSPPDKRIIRDSKDLTKKLTTEN